MYVLQCTVAQALQVVYVPVQLESTSRSTIAVENSTYYISSYILGNNLWILTSKRPCIVDFVTDPLRQRRLYDQVV